MKLNMDNVNKRLNELTYFKGFVPFQFWCKIDMLKRDNFLEHNGLFDKVNEENIVHRNAMKSSGDSDAYADKLLKKWIKDNPMFMDCVILD